MKSRILLICSCLLLLAHTGLRAQMKRVIKSSNGNIAVTPQVPSPAISFTAQTTSCSSDTIMLTSQAQINNFSTSYATCTNPKYLIIDGTGATPAITSLAGLSNITQIINNLEIRNTRITSLSQLTALTNIGDSLILRTDTVLTSIGLSNLTNLGGIYCRNVPLLTTLAGLSNNITSINFVFIDSANSLSNISGLGNIHHVVQNFELDRSAVTNLTAVQNINTIGGWLWLDGNADLTAVHFNNLTECHYFIIANSPLMTDMSTLSYHLDPQFQSMGTFILSGLGVTDMTGMDSVKSAPNFYISSNQFMTSLHGLDNLSGQTGISLYGNTAMTDMSALHNITGAQDNVVELAYNFQLTNLNGLQNITTIGALWMHNNSGLTSLSELNQNLLLRTDYQDTTRIFDNNALSTCSFGPLCNYIASGGKYEIHDNAAGCSSAAEITAACGLPCPVTDDKLWNGSVSDDWNDGANWTPAGLPQLCSKVTIPDQDNVPNSPLAGSDIAIGGLIMENNAHLDLNFFNINVTGTLNLQPSVIDNGNNFTATHVFAPKVEGVYMSAKFTCTEFSGQSDFDFSYFEKDVILSDSTGRNENVNIYLNTFAQNLICIDNSDYGNFYLGNVSSNFSQDIHGNLTAINNSLGGLNIGLAGERSLRINGDFHITANAGSVDIVNIDFFDYNTSHLSKTGGGVINIEKLTNEKYGYLYFDNPVQISQKLTLGAFSGAINTTTTNLLTLEGNAQLNLEYTYGIINGPMKKIMNQSDPFTFPIGKIEQNTYWRAPFTITPSAFTTNEFVAEYFHHNANVDGYDTSHYAPGFGKIQGKEYWMLNRPVGSDNVKVTLPFDTARSGQVSDINNLQVGSWSGTQWNSLSVGNISGQLYAGAVSSGLPVTTYGPIAFSFKPIRRPIVTIGNFDSLICENHYFRIPIALDTLPLAGNYFSVEVSDSSGNFNTFFNPGLGGKASHALVDTIDAFASPFLGYNRHYKIRVVGNLLPDTSVNVKPVSRIAIPQNFTVTGPDPVCTSAGVVKYYVNVHEPGVTYTWSLPYGGTFTQVGDTAFVTWTIPGYQYLTCASNNSCSNGSPFGSYVHVIAGDPVATPTITNTGRWLYVNAPPPSLTYQWYRNGTPISGATSSSYYASLGGIYTHRYSGLCGPNAISNAITFAAASVPQTISFAAIPNKTYGDAAFSISASTNSGLPVSLSVTGGPGYILGNVFTITGTGVVTVTATQPGDNIYDTAAPVTRTFTVNKAAQTINFATIPPQDYSTGSVNLNATASSTLPVGYAVVSGPATISGSTVTFTGIGTVTIRATQTGDTNYLPALNADRSFCVSVATLSPISGFANLCPNTASYSVNNIPGATYFWRIAGGATLPSVTNTASVNWTMPGDYTLLVSASGNCGTACINDTLQVHVISGIQPDSVHNMLPANNSINQQLPLVLSWVPAQPGSFYTFDIYIWQASQAQPSTPFVSGITTVNYTVPVSSGLLSNTAYKWMVVAHNGSCTVIHTGPVQQFTLIPLPDLAVSNVQAPATAFSGQNVSISWTVTNNGPGITNTNQSWTDAVFMSFDDHPNFNIPPDVNPGIWSSSSLPLRPLLLQTKPNVSALNVGESYNNSINFTLPVNYSQPVYVFVISNYPAGGNAPQQTTYANDTAHKVAPIMVTLSPTPDLRVDSVFASNSTFSGGTLNVTYKVKNYGVVTPPGVTWVDKFYLSQTATFNAATSVPLYAPLGTGKYYDCYTQPYAVTHNTQVNADGIYTNTVPLVMPNFIYGTYFIHVITNATTTLYEGALINNNTNSKQTQIFLTPTPELTVSTLTIPLTTASTTQPVGVNWSITNSGLYDNIEKNQGHYAKAGAFCGNFLTGYTAPPNSQPIYSPGFSYTDSLGWGSSFYTDKIYLSRDSGDINTVTLIPIGSFDHGYASSAPLCDDYNNTCLLGGNHDRNLQNIIRPNTSYPGSFQFNVPDTLSTGNYYVYVLTNANHTVYEFPAVSHYKISGRIAVQRPDLIPPVVNVPAAVTGGQTFNISYTVANNGPGGVYNHLRNDKIYVSTSPTFNASATLISTQTFTENINEGSSVTHSYAYTFLPGTPNGTRYFYVHTNYDSAFKEINGNNNISNAAVIVVTTAAPNDLIVSTVQLPAVTNDSLFTLTPYLFKYAVTNNGAGTTQGTWTDSIFVSCTPAFNSNTAKFLQKRTHSDVITTGGVYRDSFALTVPQLTYELNNCFPVNNAPAYFFVKVNADNIVYEGAATNNNTTSASQKTLVNPFVDHIVTQVSGADTAFVGRNYAASFTVKNIGYYTNYGYYYYNWNDAVYFSPDSVFNGNAIGVSYNPEDRKLFTDQTYNRATSFVIPNITEGDYYVHARTNSNGNITAENNTTNNTNIIRTAGGEAKKIHVTLNPLPDITDTIIAAPVLVAVGQPLNMIYKIKNSGAGATYPNNFYNSVWLSTDFVPGNGNDIFLVDKTFNGTLNAGQSYNDTIAPIVPLNTTPGNYVLIVQANRANNVVETNTANNLTFKYITVYTPAPSDLTVVQVSRPDTVLLGYTMDTAKWVVRNNSSNAAQGVSSDGIYFSKSTVLDSTAILMGINTRTINIAPVANDTITKQPLITNVTEGNYNVIVKTDLLNNIFESNKNNNVGISATPVYVKVKELPINVLESNILQSTTRFYKLIIGDTLKGSTILVTLKSADSLSSTNQMYIGKGYIPTASHFDYAYDKPNYGNQDIVISSVDTGVYYISINKVLSTNLNQSITLKARKLPFEILTVQSSSGGNTGNVTVKINGSLFNNAMTARLYNAGTSITASNVYFVNSTSVFATFNLQGKPLGVYNVELHKTTDSTTAVLPNSFSIVPPNNGGLITGGGVNTGAGNGNDPGCDPGAASGLNSQLVTEIVIPDRVLGGWIFLIQINYNNPTNVDIPAQTRVLYSKDDVPISLSQTMTGSTTSMYLELTEQNGPPGIIRAGGSGSIVVYGKAPVTYPAHKFAHFELK